MNMARIGRREHIWNLMRLAHRTWDWGGTIGDISGWRTTDRYRIKMEGDDLRTARCVLREVWKVARHLGGIKFTTTERVYARKYFTIIITVL
jgi:hypothetical protein